MRVDFAALKPQDVVWVKFPYEEDSTRYKIRPAIIIDKDDDELEIVVVKVTTKPPRNNYDYVLIEWVKASLKKPSIARTSKIEIIRANEIKGKIGSLDDKDFNEIMILVNEYINNN